MIREEIHPVSAELLYMARQDNVRVLVVEDSSLVAEMLWNLLDDSGYTVVGTAVNAPQALEMTRTLRPDVVLMDIELPDMDGIEVTRQIFQECPTPVVMVTAHDTPELVRQASQAGAGAYVLKPPTERELDRAITIAMARFDDLMELRRLNRELEARNRDLDAFAHTVAHDLQSPLGLIIGFADLLRQEFSTLSPEEVEQYLNMIVSSGRKLSGMIDALLLLAGVRSADVPRSPLDMEKIVSEALNRLTPLIEEYQPEIILPDRWPSALGYAVWVEEVWVNYISNGIKYGGRPPRLELGANLLSNGMIRFWVRDNGVGIPPDQQGKLFAPFTRLSQVRIKGYGLGLSIVRRIVEKLGGEVGVESDGVTGHGSTFSFTLPAAPAQE